LSQEYAIKLVKSMLWRCQAIINNKEAIGQLNNKTSSFISCMYFFSMLYSK